MRISTIEIKMLIRKCVSKGGMYTTADFCEYINRESDKNYTRGQLSGALAQLVDLGELVRIDRGLYAGKETTEQREDNNEESRDNDLRAKRQFKENIELCLNQVEKSLEDFLSMQNIWELNNDEFELLSQVRALKTTIVKIRRKCE